ncbi:uncharacterized protein UTRI_06220 [Ustilago trichophora]|uniref:Uncharacterized protein n=1 Tax=Ustilago trichophora TaxID=86804 RepID=A0A5C3EIE1_9BASI|nr:uncharacterized protein UTRI_06220 [Ustilago trichophora]
MKVLLLIAVQVFIACCVLGTASSPDTSHDAGVPTTLDTGTPFRTVTSLRADAQPFVPQSRMAFFQPSYYVPTPPAFQPVSLHLSPSSTNIATHSVPLPGYIPPKPTDVYMKLLKNAFYSKLRSIVHRPRLDITSIHPPFEYSASYMPYLHAELERNKFQPVIPLDLLPMHHNTEARLYAYMLEATPDMVQTLDPSRRRETQWAILEVHPGMSPRVNVLAYLQTASLDIDAMRMRLTSGMESRTFALEDVLRKVPLI